MRHRLSVIVLCTVVMASAGCATRPPHVLPASNEAIGAFSLNARVAVKMENRGYTATMRWHHTAERDVIRLLSPVGSTVGELEADASGATLRTGDKKVYRAEDAQALTRDVLGWDLPLAGLRYWVTGRVDPDAPLQGQERDDKQRLKSLTQNDWHITYLEYFKDGALPARMTLTYDRLSLRLLVERWDLSE
jgi:outer membrane lipoprotein LolB